MQPQSRSALVAPSSPSTTLTSPRAGQPFVAIDGLEGWERLLAGRPVPACAVNLDALQANRRILEAMAAKGARGCGCPPRHCAPRACFGTC